VRASRGRLAGCEQSEPGSGLKLARGAKGAGKQESMAMEGRKDGSNRWRGLEERSEQEEAG